MKNNKKIIILAVAICVIAVMGLTACKGSFMNKETLAPIVVTDENGVPITDENGEAITIIPEGTIIEITNADGEKVYDENGDVKTSVSYQSQEVAIPVTGEDGKAVTDSNGKVVTTIILVPPTTNETSIIDVPMTDVNGVTVTNENGEVITYTLVSTTSYVDPTPNSADYSSTFGGTSLDKFIDVVSTSDGGFIALLNSNSKDGSLSGINTAFGLQNSAIVKYDKNGKLLWKKFIGGNNGCTLTSIAVDSSDNIAVVGFSKSTDLGATNQGSYDAVIYKLNTTGDTQWVKTFGGSLSEAFNDVIVTSDGGFVTCGFCYSRDGNSSILGLPNGEASATLVKYSSDGSVAFAKKVGSTADELLSISADGNGNIFAVGAFSSKTGSSLFTTLGKSDAGIIKFDSNGNTVWARSFGGSRIDYFSGIAVSPDGGCVVVGRTESNDGSLQSLSNYGGYDAAIVKYDSNGGVVWQNTFKGYSDDNFNDIAATSTGYYVVGYSNSSNRDFRTIGNRGGLDCIVLNYSLEGNVQSVEGFGGSKDDEFSAVCVLQSGQIIAVGSTLSSDGDLVGGSVTSDGKNTVGVVAKFK